MSYLAHLVATVVSTISDSVATAKLWNHDSVPARVTMKDYKKRSSTFSRSTLGAPATLSALVSSGNLIGDAKRRILLGTSGALIAGAPLHVCNGTLAVAT